MKNEPEWIKWEGKTDKCPVPIGHDVEVEFVDGAKERDNTPEEWVWRNNPERVTDWNIVAYRDWT